MIRGTTRCRQFGRAPLLEKREKGRTPSYFRYCQKNLRYIPLVKLAHPPVDQPAAIALPVLPRLHRSPVAGKSEYLPAVRRLNL